MYKHFHLALSLVFLAGLSACADYQQGYDDGYNGRESMSGLLFGADDYRKGYTEGQMQIFHDDWYAENEPEIEEGLACPAIVVKLSPVISPEKLGLFDLDRID